MTQIYLISPPKIDFNSFSQKLEVALKTKQVPVFQLRLKGYSDQEILDIGKKILTLCHQYNSVFILNDRVDLALKMGADGVHLGDQDGNVLEVRKKSPANFIIGASCYDSRHSGVVAAENGADYISFGAFFPSKTKNSKGKPTPELLEWADDFLNVKTVAIGGITAQNCAELVRAKADFLSVISCIWDHPSGVEEAVKSLSEAIKSSQL